MPATTRDVIYACQHLMSQLSALGEMNPSPEGESSGWNEPAPYGQPSDRISPEKAKQILKDDSAQGHPLTEKQKGLFGAAAGREDNERRPRSGEMNAYGGWPVDQFGGPRGVMHPLTHGEFVHGRFGYRLRQD